MISREDVAQAIERAHWPQSIGSHARVLWIADAILALIQSEVASIPVQRDARAEKLGERLDAAERQLAQELANLSATAERCRVLEERARNAEALAANLRRVDNERAIELMRVKRELAAAWLRHTWPCGHISEGTGDEPDRCRICVAEERVRKAEAAEDREASLADLLNSWARESGVAPCDRPEDSKGVADRLWAKLSLDLAAIRALRTAEGGG